MKVNYIVYKLTNIKTGLSYIGLTSKSLEHRWKTHVYNSSRNGKTKLYRAMRKYGTDCWSRTVIFTAFTSQDVQWAERHFIAEHDTYKNGYNMTLGGDGGDTSKSPNYISGMKLRNFNGQNNPMFGKSANKGKKLPEWHKKAISEKNNRRVECGDVCFYSINDASLHFVGISVRKRLDSNKYPNWIRIDPKRVPKT